MLVKQAMREKLISGETSNSCQIPDITRCLDVPLNWPSSTAKGHRWLKSAVDID